MPTAGKVLTTILKKRGLFPTTSIIILMLIIIGAILLRIHLLPMPLERDEGEYAYAGQLIMDGLLPYQHIYSMKLPGIYFAYAAIMIICGETSTAIHTGLLFIHILTILIIFIAIKRLFDEETSLLSCATFTVLSNNPYLLGHFAHTEHFVIFFALASLVLLLQAFDSGRRTAFILAGTAAGMCFLMKQSGAVYIAFGLSFILAAALMQHKLIIQELIQRGIIFLIGAVIPYILTCCFFAVNGIFDNFWFWTYSYAREYASLVSPGTGWDLFIHQISRIISFSPLLWITALLGFIFLRFKYRQKEQLCFFMMFLIFSVLAVTPGFYFREHYFILILPSISLGAAIGFSSLKTFGTNLFHNGGNIIMLLVLVPILFIPIYRERSFLFEMSPRQAIRFTHGMDPFPESMAIANYIAAHTTLQDKIAVIGSEPQIYFYSHRRAATGYVYMYQLMERHKFSLTMQVAMIKEMVSQRPAFIVVVSSPTSWLAKEGSYRLIFAWLREYLENNYGIVGIVEQTSLTTTNYIWEQALTDYRVKSPYWLAVYRRNK